VSWHAIKYAWTCQQPEVKGSPRLVLLAIATRVRRQKAKTGPTSLAQLQRLTLLTERQVRRCLDVLESVGEVRRVRRGKKAIYAMPRLVGPLFVVGDDEKADNLSGFESPPRAEKADKMSDSSADKMSGKKRSTCPDLRGISSEDRAVRTLIQKSTATAESDDAKAAAEVFLDWFVAEYPTHRGGLYQVDPVKAERVVRELLRGRSIGELQAITLRMWADRRDPWVRNSDYGVHVLKHRVTQYEQQLRTEGALRTAAPRDWYADTHARILRQLAQPPADTPLGQVCAKVSRALSEPCSEATLRRLDAELLAAARAAVVIPEIEAAAAAELASYRVRVSREEYARLFARAVTHLVRETAGIPDLTVLLDGARKDGTA